MTPEHADSPPLATDPFCGMPLDAAHAVSLGRDGQIHCFCCQGCRGRFAAANEAPEAVAGDCCPMCGMVLERNPAAALREAVADGIRPDAAEAVATLRARGLRLVMLSGDNPRTAKAVAGRFGITQVHARVLPERPPAIVQGLQQQGGVVTMAGDGVNDAPSLAQADIGIAMGTGTDVAMESAGVTLVKGGVHAIERTIGRFYATPRNIRQNLVFAFGDNTLGVPIAAGLFDPLTGLLQNPMLAAAAMSRSSVSVIGDALRLPRVGRSAG